MAHANASGILKRGLKSGRNGVHRAYAAVQSGKMRSGIRSAEKELDQRYRELGELAAERLRKNPGSEITEREKELLAAIGSLREAEDGMRQQLFRIRGLKKCAECGSMIHLDVAFCPKCGAPARVITSRKE